MPPFVVRCPECQRWIELADGIRAGRRVRCPSCGTALVPRSDGAEPTTRARRGREEGNEAFDDAEWGEGDYDQPRRRPGRGRNTGMRVLLGVLLGCGGLLVLLCAGVGLVFYWALSPTAFPPQAEDYAQARRHFQTRLRRHGPAPQTWQREVPPAGVREVEYPSGRLRLKAWVNGPPADGRPRPAVLFLHGGFSFAAEDWDQAQPFRDAGFIVLTPMVRGENGLPGDYSMFYNEVDDVLAAADFLAGLPYVDRKRLYVAGHSVGGTLTLLAAMTSNRFRAAASFSGSPDQVLWSRGQPEKIPFDRNDLREFQMRSPLAFAQSFKCPVRLYYGSEEFGFRASSQKTAELARAAGLDVQAVSVPGDHLSSVAPAMQQCITFFQRQ